MFGAVWQLAIFYTPTGEVVRLIQYNREWHAKNAGVKAMKWLNPDRFHFVVLPQDRHLPEEAIGVRQVSETPCISTK